ncbi:Photosystem II 5 kDa protein, chloroplastic [Capsicum annuum]|nr:Photosystem II 5 kDa protein, chloroplastic [Capsicum annuum]
MNSDWVFRDGLLFFKNRVYLLPNSPLVNFVLSGIHDSTHEGVQKTMLRIHKDFYWPAMKTTIKDYVAACSVCQRNKAVNLSPAGLLQPLQLPNQIWSDISMDFIDGLPKSGGKTVLLVVVDRFSKYAHFSPLAYPYNASSIARIFFENIVRLHGIRESIVSDRDALFTILKCIGSVAYQLGLPTGCKLHDVFHVSLRKPFKGEVPTTPPTLPPVEEGCVVPTPCSVLKSRLNCGNWEILVEWCGQSVEDSMHHFKLAFPDFKLEDKLFLREGDNVIDAFVGKQYSRRKKSDFQVSRPATLSRARGHNTFTILPNILPKACAVAAPGALALVDRFLAYGPEQHPIVLQIGGNKLENLAKATQLATPYGYDEINLNCGCPSPKVAGHGCFGVRLMLDPKLVAEAMSVIAANTNVPVSVKCRIGVDDHDSYNELCDFIYEVSSQSPTQHFIIHSRKALLNGISPKDNRKIPPLKYEYYYALLRDFPGLQFTINGGITSIEEVNAARTEGAHGVMLGRAAYGNPWQILGLVDSAVYGAPLRSITRRQVLEQYQVYGDSVLGMYGPRPTVREVVKPLLGLFHAEPRNVAWKRKVDAAFRHCTTIKSLFEETLGEIPDSVLDAPITEVPSGSTDKFIKAKSLLPSPYTVKEEELLYA